ncbi:HpcH/HpaI aldolase family protein [Jatrophihabitans lederbergiae]|uniref:Aldolase/citrate lyase family protein n=1 Tax=Jatrophihabitans lederbergiae TaxID=3075547 RepID=A0ABU2JBS7_9ACTN|nr:aldolase/citrate lyase family protein [Jatrophihabitans sp. DSM 44399]MDT0262443.1 aldolase/citrate lyase family protein [Jatrophihabitans sp. DSM 44399]
MTHPLAQLASPLRTALDAYGVATGFFSVTGESEIVELFAVCGADFVVLDMEAAPMTKREALHCLQALTGSSCAGVVRVPWLQHHLIEHALDAGAHGIIVPKVDTAEQAAAAVAATYFPPIGIRGLNPVRASAYFTELEAYLAGVNARTTCFVQIESVESVRNVDEIAAVPGLSGLFIGAGDLAAAFGHPGNPVGADMDDARAAVLRACEANGIVPGIFAYSLELAVQYRREGFRLIAIGNEIKMLKDATVDALAAAREQS